KMKKFRMLFTGHRTNKETFASVLLDEEKVLLGAKIALLGPTASGKSTLYKHCTCSSLFLNITTDEPTASKLLKLTNYKHTDTLKQKKPELFLRQSARIVRRLIENCILSGLKVVLDHLGKNDMLSGISQADI